MSHERYLNQSDLVQSSNRGLAARPSSLVQRGLELLRSSQPRVVRFPPDRSMGTLYIRDEGEASEAAWKEFGEAHGNVTIPAGKELRIRVKDEASIDLSPLAALRSNDLQQLQFGALESWILIQEGKRRQVSDADLVHLQELTGLQSLNLSQTQVTDAAVVALRRILPNCHIQK